MRHGLEPARRGRSGRLPAARPRLQAVRLRDLSRRTRRQGPFLLFRSLCSRLQACVSVLPADGTFNVDNVRTIKVLGGGVVESTLLK